MRHLAYIIAFIPFLAFSQVSTTKSDKSAFKSVPTLPYEDIKRSGLVVVTKSMYGLRFENEQLPEATKKIVKSFFKLRLKEYSSLKKYHLKIEKLVDGIYINRVLLKP
ncbi:hypothetical protein [Tenacibaculum maritimum]|uniref:hypothetical protein n=1 Tax=Tenacibaculum maritimum TaxID=107401 RepID=UPI0013301973|nr:hypothetical protein [Tenacibaculum maritimum]MCD9582296.1 hypothetical protein [Tenacibaculum maritimum]MCD9636678.1 hypothetical protein [Tenacibaculum maritimum]